MVASRQLWPGKRRTKHDFEQPGSVHHLIVAIHPGIRERRQLATQAKKTGRGSARSPTIDPPVFDAVAACLSTLSPSSLNTLFSVTEQSAFNKRPIKNARRFLLRLNGSDLLALQRHEKRISKEMPRIPLFANSGHLKLFLTNRFVRMLSRCNEQGPGLSIDTKSQCYVRMIGNHLPSHFRP